ncbi:hypothetical protein CPB84DRAFT_1841112 [Gymnopilus junonius]|uniref:Uncharacterized protein n=1 Tax=Gymnopilus junonius TaxID=109634 RepID=A0A9P5TVG5_GYMJU|nr:hypothetical protein CPB84DRAFT_1841112 [Gymnopilus junonius]
MCVKARLAKKAPSQKLSATDPECSEQKPAGDSGGTASEDLGKVVVVKKQNSNLGHPFFQDAKKLGTREHHNKLDLTIVKFFCVAGLPTSLFVLASRAKLEEEQIVSEAESILELQTAYLQTQENITVSCDGGTTWGRDAFWMVHMSTMGTKERKRKVYLMEVREATSESHTGKWIKTFLLNIIDKIGRSFTKEILMIFNLPDIVHFISNTLKDIVKLAHFKPTITTVRGVVKKFHKSHPGATELRIVHLICGITKGLDAIGKTRFGTIILSAWSVQINIPALQKIVEQGIFDLEDLETYFIETSLESFQFKKTLLQLIKVGSPALKALTCLEADEMNPGDVYIFWHAMLWAMKEVLVDSKLDFPTDVRHQILGILNARHSQIFEDGNLATAADLYLARAYLNPMYLKSDLFRRDEDLVAQFLVTASQKEILFGDNEKLTKWKGRASDFKKKLLDEMKRYARQQFPFNTPSMKTLASLPGGKHLNVTQFKILAVKVFSVRVNSMAEERTVSIFTWMMLALHANLSVGQMAAKTIVRQHYATEKKARKHSKPRPTVKFYDVKSKIFWTTDTSDSPKVLDDEDDSWLDEKAESHPTAQSLGAETNRSSPVNLQSSMLATFLVDGETEERRS